jgi:flagellin
MALVVNTNVASITSQMYVNQTNKDMGDTMARLSSGKRINTAADDAAGVAISSRLQEGVRGTNQAIRNAADAQALIDTAEGAQVEVVNILQRMRELAVQAANDTNSAADRSSLADEMTALTAEIDRIANVSSWAGEILLDGATPNASQTTETGNASFTFHIGSGNSAADSITANIAAVGSTALGINGSGVKPQSLTDMGTTATGVMTVSQGAGTIVFSGTQTAADIHTVKVNGTTVAITVSAADKYEVNNVGVAAQMKDALEAAGIAGLSVSDNGSGTLTLTLGQSVDISSASNAQTAIGTIDNAIATVNSQRADLGAISNRLDSTIANLSNIAINLEDGRSRIEDADFAQESANLAKQQIMLQAGTAMLAQANASQQNVLSLLS